MKYTLAIAALLFLIKAKAQTASDTVYLPIVQIAGILDRTVAEDLQVNESASKPNDISRHGNSFDRSMQQCISVCIVDYYNDPMLDMKIRHYFGISYWD